MMLWTARARLSVPPPGPAVATNSIGLCGCQAACAGTAPAPTSRIAASGSNDLKLMFMDSSASSFLWVVGSLDRSSGHLRLAGGCSRNDCALALEGLDLRRIEAVFAQNFARVLAIDRGARTHLSRCRREFHRQSDRLHRSQRGMLDLDHHF